MIHFCLDRLHVCNVQFACLYKKFVNRKSANTSSKKGNSICNMFVTKKEIIKHAKNSQSLASAITSLDFTST